MKGNRKKIKTAGKNVKVSLNPDTTPVLYTDNIHMVANDDGVVLDVIQKIGKSNQARIVARVGMSREHAKKFVEKLGKLLITSESKSVRSSKMIN